MKPTYFLPALLLFCTSCSPTPDYDATGFFEATTVTVASETAGRILSFSVAEGDSVSNGETIAVIDTTLLVLQQKQFGSQQQSAVSSSPDISAQVASLRTQITHQQNEVDRQTRLLADGTTTRQRYDDAVSLLRTLQDQLQAQLSLLNKSRSSISDNASALQYQQEQIATQIDRSVVRSPLSGSVLVKYAEAGEYAVPGKPLVKIADLNNIYLRAYFTDAQLSGIHIGQDVKVIADYGGDNQIEYPGKIIWIAQESEFTPKSIQTRDSRANLVYAVKIAVVNDGRLKLGQYGEVIL